MKTTFNLKILTTSDIHGSILPIKYADNSSAGFGMSRISTLLKTQRDENTLLIDVGDAIQGSPLMYFHKNNREQYSNPVADVFNYLKYDYFVPGNHDFNYGRGYLEDFLKSLNMKVLSANIFDESNNNPFGMPYDIVKFKNGPTVAILGLTTQYIPHWESPQHIKGLSFEDVFEVAKKQVKEIRKNYNVDVMIVAYHGGFERDLETDELNVIDTGENRGSKIVDEIDGIDVLLTGHQHRQIAMFKNNKSIIQPGCNAAFLGKVELKMRYVDGAWKIVDRFQELIPSENFESDKVCENLIEGVEKATQKFLDQAIGIVEYDNLEIKNPLQARLEKHPVVTFINEVQLEATGADISATSLANDVTGFKKVISVRNVLSTYVYPNTLVVMKITGEILKEYLERNAEYFEIKDGKIVSSPRFSYPKNQHYNYDMLDGIEYTIDITKDYGNRIVELKREGNDIKKDDVFTIALNNYRASGGGDFEMIQDLPIVKEIPLDIAELITDFIKKRHSIVCEDKKNIKIIANII